jgi:hypothetical protein
VPHRHGAQVQTFGACGIHDHVSRRRRFQRGVRHERTEPQKPAATSLIRSLVRAQSPEMETKGLPHSSNDGRTGQLVGVQPHPPPTTNPHHRPISTHDHCHFSQKSKWSTDVSFQSMKEIKMAILFSFTTVLCTIFDGHNYFRRSELDRRK